MLSRERYLHFDNIDMTHPRIFSNCSVCSREFNDQPRPGEHVEEALRRIRAKFDVHDCNVIEAN